MNSPRRLLAWAIGADPKLRRMMGYWAATGLIYALCIILISVQIGAGTVPRLLATLVCWACAIGTLFFFALIRASAALRIPAAKLTVAQALLSITCCAGAYVVMGPLRGALLMIMLVVIVFCAFSLRPRATLMLGATGLAAFGATMLWMVNHDPVRFPASVESTHFALLAACVLSVSLLTGEMARLRTLLKHQKEELLAAVVTIQTLATVDDLTRLSNRRHMHNVLDAEERRQSSAGESVCIALLDLDFFKAVNDRFGHAGGDAVLRSFASAARTALRTNDTLARWGGEEFLLMLPDTTLAEAEQVLRRMAGQVRASQVSELDADLTITFSAGLVERQGNEAFADTINRADKAMYTAKSSGRDRVIAA